MVKNPNFEKLLKKCLDIDLKIIFSKHYVPMPKTMYMRFCSFYAIMSLHAKKCVCRSNELACGQYKDKEEKKLRHLTFDLLI